jgi:hypothetical protein
MPTTYKVLGQVAPTNTSDTDLYTAPASTQTVISTLSVTNDTTSAATFRIYVRVNGAAASATNTLYFDTALAANSTLMITCGLTIDAADVITVRSSVANALTFQAFGSEVTP